MDNSHLDQGWARQRQRKSNGKRNVLFCLLPVSGNGKQQNFRIISNAFVAGNETSVLSATLFLPETKFKFYRQHIFCRQRNLRSVGNTFVAGNGFFCLIGNDLFPATDFFALSATTRFRKPGATCRQKRLATCRQNKPILPAIQTNFRPF